MLDAADVLVHRQPVVHPFVDHLFGLVRAGIAQEIPGRIDKGIHGIGLALGRFAAFRTTCIQEIGALVQRIAAAVRHAILGQYDRQLVFGYRHVTTTGAMHDRDRATPVALTRDAPVAQPPGDLLVAEALCFQIRGNRLDRYLEIQAVVLAGMDANAVVGIPGLPRIKGIFLAFDVDDLRDAQAVLLGERKIPFVVAWHAHDCAFAVAHQHVVADPDFDFLAGQRMTDEQAGGHALLFHRRDVGFHDAAALALLHEGGQFWIALRGFRGKRMFRGHRAKGDAHDRIGAGGEYPELVGLAVQLVRKSQAHAETLADPVRLHGLHALRPAGQRIQGRQQFLRVFRDREVVHRNLALLHECPRAPAATVDHLLVGKHRLVDRVPVHRAGLLVSDALFQHAQEQPLVPAIVLRRAGRQFTLPVDGETQRLELLFHVRDVVVGPFCRRHVVGHRGVFGGQAESVPSHRLQDIEAAHAVIAGEHVADGVVAHMAHVQLARRIREHGQAVILRFARNIDRAEGLLVLPLFLQLLFDAGGLILRLHEESDKAL